jgi:hypothetical protein
MRVLGTAVMGLLLVCGTAWRAWSKARARRKKQKQLEPGSVVLVHTPDQKTVVATVRSRGPSHFWIELLPGDARFWVPATAVEPAPEHAVRERAHFKSTPPPEPRAVLDSEI